MFIDSHAHYSHSKFEEEFPAVAEKVAELKGLDRETVLRVTTENTIRLFDLRG